MSCITDDWLDQHEKELEEHGWVRMPEDADGKHWLCGDKIMLPDGNVVEIIGIGGDWLYYCVTSVSMTVFGRIRAHDKHHYEQPTVEDLLRQFLGECEHASMLGYTDMPQDIFDTYTAKLSLASDAE